MAGRLGCGGGPPTLFFPSRCFEAARLEKGVSDHRHQGMSMQAGPGSAFEVIEAEFLLELLMRLFADPSGLDCCSKLFKAHIWRQIRHIVFLLPCRPAFANKPNLLSRHTLHTLVMHAMFVAVRNANTSSSEETREPTFRSPPPTDPLPFRLSQCCFS